MPTGPVSIAARCRRRGARRPRSARSSRWGRELSSPLSPMQRPCRGVRCEHKVNAVFSPEGTCERGAAAWERLLCGAAFPDEVVRTCARQRACARDGAEEKIVGLGAWMMERTRSCVRSEHEARSRSCACPRASAGAGPGTRRPWHGPRRCWRCTEEMERAPVRSQLEVMLWPSPAVERRHGCPRCRGTWAITLSKAPYGSDALSSFACRTDLATSFSTSAFE